MAEKATAEFRPFVSLAEALDGPESAYFGIGPDGKGKRVESYYQSLDDYVSFDVGNNQILCSIAANGLLTNACVLQDVVPGPGLFDKLPGVFAHKELIGGGPWPFALQLRGQDPVNLHELPGTAVALLHNLLPRYTFRHAQLVVDLLAFAPTGAAPNALPPRGLVVVLRIRSEAAGTIEGALLAQARVPDLATVGGDGAQPDSTEAILCLDDTAWDPRHPEFRFCLKAGESVTFALGLLLGESAAELARTGLTLRQRPALEWLNQTCQHHSERLGRLTIPEAPYYAEAFGRFRELCRQSVLQSVDGRFGAGFWGSDFVGVSGWASPKIWNKDNFHAMLPMAMLEPELCREAILFFLRWSLPQAAYGPAVGRFPNPKRITHSLANALSPLVLAGAYYQATGDSAFFRKHPEILDRARDLLRAVLESQQGAVFLFPSLYISDGESRGDYHTGSNLLVWHCFHHLARIAGEAYDEPALAAEWAESAAKVKEALLTHCVGDASLGRRFLEGANADGTWVTCHDGEETDVALMPFYGFCDADEPALLNHSRLALSPENPLFAPGLEGIWWGDDHQPAATFPGWMTGLASASTPEEIGERLELIRRLTDHDGSIWWWPYKHPETDPARVRRREPWFELDVNGRKQKVGVGKCGWAAGVYLCLFINNLLGIRVEVPAHRVSLRPFCPWPEFAWTGCRLGDSCFDFSYRHGDGLVVGEIANRTERPFAGTIELPLPLAATATRVSVDGQPKVEAERTRRYGRPAVLVARDLAPGENLRLQVAYRV